MNELKCSVCDNDLNGKRSFVCDNCGIDLCDYHSYEDEEDRDRILCYECLIKVRKQRAEEAEKEDDEPDPLAYVKFQNDICMEDHPNFLF